LSIELSAPEAEKLKPRLAVLGVGGGGGNVLRTMIKCGLTGVDLYSINTDAQALEENILQENTTRTTGIGRGIQLLENNTSTTITGANFMRVIWGEMIPKSSSTIRPVKQQITTGATAAEECTNTLTGVSTGSGSCSPMKEGTTTPS